MSVYVGIDVHRKRRTASRPKTGSGKHRAPDTSRRTGQTR